MKILFFSILSLLSIFSIAQSNQFPANGNVQIFNGYDLIFNTQSNGENQSRIKFATGVIGDEFSRELDISTTNGIVFKNKNLLGQPYETINLYPNFLRFSRTRDGASGHLGGRGDFYSSHIEFEAPSNSDPFYQHASLGTLFRTSQIDGNQKLSGIGISLNSDKSFKHLFITHNNIGNSPWNSTLGINILPSGFTGIGTLTPTTTLEITSLPEGNLNGQDDIKENTLSGYGNSGLRLTHLTSANDPTPNAAPIGVDATGKVVRVEGGGSSSDAWLLSGNEETNPLVNFLGTTDNQPLVIRTNNAQTLRINTSGRLVFYNSDLSINAANSNLYIAGGNDSPIPGHTGIASNTVVGISSFRANTSGQFNTVFGNSLLYKNTTGSTNTVIGYNSMINSTTGSQNVVVGSNSMNAATTSTQNVVVGNNALTAVTTTGNYNVAVGNGSLSKTTTGRYNIYLGYYDAATGITTGTRNIGIGYNAGKNLTTGTNNIIIGSEYTEGFPNVIVNAPISGTSSNQLNIGNWIYGYNGQIAIGNFTNIPQVFSNPENANYQLIVKNGIKTEKVRVELSNVNGWPDYVFEKDYQLIPLKELETFVSTHKHLPNVPKAEEVKKEGIDLGQMDAKLLEKIEELTLYNIELYKESKSLKEENQLLKAENKQQQQLLEDLLKRVEKLESHK